MPDVTAQLAAQTGSLHDPGAHLAYDYGTRHRLLREVLGIAGAAFCATTEECSERSAGNHTAGQLAAN